MERHLIFALQGFFLNVLNAHLHCLQLAYRFLKTIDA